MREVDPILGLPGESEGTVREVDPILGLPGESEAGERHALDLYRAHTRARIGGYRLARLPRMASVARWSRARA